jgi:hypothetical protein
MMFGDGSLSFREFVMHEPLPLATIQDAVLQFLRGKDECALFGAQAVNAYVDEPRMTQDVDILSSRAAELAEELRAFLSQRFHMAARVREIGQGRGYRIFQVQKPRNRHLVDVRAVDRLPPSRKIMQVRVVAPEELIAGKILAYHGRQGNPKSFTDRRDLAVLLLRFPKLKKEIGPVRQRLIASGADATVLSIWARIVKEKITREREDDEFRD